MKKIKIINYFTEEELSSIADSLRAAANYYDKLIYKGWNRSDLKMKSVLCHELAKNICVKLTKLGEQKNDLYNKR